MNLQNELRKLGWSEELIEAFNSVVKSVEAEPDLLTIEEPAALVEISNLISGANTPDTNAIVLSFQED